MTQETTMQTEPMNVDTKDLSCAEALELAIAETRLALCEFGDLADERLIVRDAWCEDAYQKVDAGLDRCKAAADGLAAHARVVEMGNAVAGEQLRNQQAELQYLHHYVADCNDEIDRLATDLGKARTPQQRQAEHYDGRPNLKCALWVVGLVLLGACIEAANGLLGRLL